MLALMLSQAPAPGRMKYDPVSSVAGHNTVPFLVAMEHDGTVIARVALVDRINVCTSLLLCDIVPHSNVRFVVDSSGETLMMYV